MTDDNGFRIRQNSRKRLKRTPPEKHWDHRVGEILTELGLFNYKTAERLYAGAPDRYIVGGNWIEFKGYPYAGRVETSNPMRMFKPGQRRFNERLYKAGDRPWVGVFWVLGERNAEVRMTLMPWPVFRDTGHWTMEHIVSVSCPVDDMKHYISERFGKNFERFSDYDAQTKP